MKTLNSDKSIISRITIFFFYILAGYPGKKQNSASVSKKSTQSYTQCLTNLFTFCRLNKCFKIDYNYKIFISELKPDTIPVFQYNSNWEHTFDAIRSDMIRNNTW